VSRLFIELYLDEDVDVLLAELLRARGFQVITTVEAGQLGQSDSSQLQHAVTHRRTLLTHNRVDFEKITQEYFQAGRDHQGVIIAVRRSPQELAKRLLIILNHVTADEMENQLRYI
jgi:hypothetical protein